MTLLQSKGYKTAVVPSLLPEDVTLVTDTQQLHPEDIALTSFFFPFPVVSPHPAVLLPLVSKILFTALPPSW